MSEEVTSYKGFDSDMKCRGRAYEVGATYVHEGEVEVCESGWHACEYPLDVFSYYPPTTSRYAIVKQSGDLRRHNGDTKIASAKITIKTEIALPQLIECAIKWVFDRANPENTIYAAGYRGAASATGAGGAASATGYQGAASATGYQGSASATDTRGAASATGEQGAASATGEQGAASATGEQGAASATGARGAASATGYQGAASATGYQGAASATGARGAASATGARGAASATGEQGAASATGYQGTASATGEYSCVLACGYYSRVSGAIGCALFLTRRDPKTGAITHTWSGIVGKDGVQPGTWYQLGDKGELITL